MRFPQPGQDHRRQVLPDAARLTLGPADAEEQLRYAVSVGMQKGVLLPVTDGEWDPQRTAAAITSAVQQIESADGAFDLILFGGTGLYL